VSVIKWRARGSLGSPDDWRLAAGYRKYMERMRRFGLAIQNAAPNSASLTSLFEYNFKRTVPLDMQNRTSVDGLEEGQLPCPVSCDFYRIRVLW
jgi:hypothetical protein